ncbi:MAG: hypothetical protein WCH84_10505 [Verrucomicrobiota bacterium]
MSDLTLSTAETVTGATKKGWSVTDKVRSALEKITYALPKVAGASV